LLSVTHGPCRGWAGAGRRFPVCMILTCPAVPQGLGAPAEQRSGCAQAGRAAARTKFLYFCGSQKPCWMRACFSRHQPRPDGRAWVTPGRNSG